MKGLWFNLRSVSAVLDNPIGKGNIGFVSLLLRRRQSTVALTTCADRSYHKQCVLANVSTQPWRKQQRYCPALRHPSSLPDLNLWQNFPSRGICTSPSRLNAGDSNATLSVASGSLGQIKPKLALKYKCNICGHQNSHTFSKESYESGVVIVQCQGCNSHHLVADNLGWFADKDR